jgi:predicted Zn-dependent protease
MGDRGAAAAARSAYATALACWPENLLALIGSGNTAYAMRDLAAAATAYRRATQAHPRSADAWNNLAQALHELGHRREAGERAVALGGPRSPTYRDTLRTIIDAR